MRRLLVLSLFSIASLPISAQETWTKDTIICSTRDTFFEAFLPPASAVTDQGPIPGSSEIILNFSGNVPSEAEEAMTFAATIWGGYLQTEVPIRVDVDWEDQGDERLLASAGPTTFFRAFSFTVDPDVWYPVALAEAIAREDLNDEGDADIDVVVNSEANWYFGTDGNTPRNRIDLATVFLHELGHGLGFLSSVDTVTTEEVEIGFGGRFVIFDPFLQTPGGLDLTDAASFFNPSPELLAAVIVNLNFSGPEATDRNDGDLVPLFAPETFDVGSSVSHLDEFSYFPGTENALMTPFVGAGEAVHDPGPVTLGIFFDLGWPLRFDLPTSVRDLPTETLAVFPNPAADEVTIPLEGIRGATLAVLHDASGRQLRRRAIGPGSPTARIEVADLRSGLYTLTIDAADRRYVARVVVN